MICCNFSVYEHINKINNKKYIGITSQIPSNRWGRDGIGYKYQPKFYNAILKYGWDNFYHNIIFNNLSQKEALDKESELILLNDSINNGYNTSFGGSGYSKEVICLTTNQIFNSVNDAAKYANIDNSTLSHCLNGDWDTAGIINNQKLEWKFVIDDFNIVPFQKKVDRLYNKIKNYNKKILLEQEIINEYTNNNKSIRQIAEERHMARDIIKKYLLKNNITILSSLERGAKPVLMYDKEWNFIKEFNSSSEALRFLGLTDSNISRLKKACEEEWRIFKGYKWKYKGDKYGKLSF